MNNSKRPKFSSKLLSGWCNVTADSGQDKQRRQCCFMHEIENLSGLLSDFIPQNGRFVSFQLCLRPCTPNGLGWVVKAELHFSSDLFMKTAMSSASNLGLIFVLD